MEEKWVYFEGRITALASEEAKKSPNLKKLLAGQASILEELSDG